MTTEVITSTIYNTIVVGEGNDTIIVESPSQSYVIVTPGEQGPPGPAGIEYISDAKDVDIAALNEGSLLVYSSQSQKWVATNQLQNQSIESGQY